jgi:hypothetical protein
MLEGRRALDLALGLARMPTLAAGMREQPLPPDTLVLIRIAAGCADTAQEAAAATGTQVEAIREAAIFYLQQVLFASSSDSHRILGVRPGASRSEMRSHLRWLMKWLHPDRNPNDWESVFAERVIGAWRDAGSRVDAPEEEEHSEASPAPHHSRRRRGARRARQRWIALPISPSRKDQQRKRKQIAAVLIVATVGLALALFPYRVPLGGWFGIPKLAAEDSVHAD